jgi:hypothetical protein
MTIFRQLQAAYPHYSAISLLQDAYAAPRSLEALKHQMQENLPSSERLIGYAAIGNAEAEPMLWLPFGSRRVNRVLSQDTPEQLMKLGIHYVVIEDYPSLDCRNIQVWVARYHARLVADIPFQKREYLAHVYITRLDAQ